jgi:hypothetical protein
MMFVLFIGWVVFVFISSDLVGSELKFRLSLPTRRQAFATDHGAAQRLAPVDFVHSTLLGFAALWVGLSAAYAIGIATQPVIAAFIGLVAAGAALAKRRNVLGWTRSRLTSWGLVVAIALLASLVAPVLDTSDDPEYVFLVDKLLRTGSIVEYFNYHRTETLGGWTFVQAIFSAGPAGFAFVASIDAVLGGVLFLCCALSLGIGPLAALPAAQCLVLVVSLFQANLGTAVTMAAMCAVLVSLSLPACAPKNLLTPLAFAVMAVTIRPQLGLVAIVGIGVVLWRNRSVSSLLIAGAILVGITALWVAIFYRDTGLLPLSLHPGLNPLVSREIEDPLLYKTTLLSEIVSTFWVNRWATGSLSLTVLAAVICGWLSVAGKHSAATRNEFRVLGAFSIAVIATFVLLIAALGPVAPVGGRYHIPVVEGFLYAFLIRSIVQVLRQGAGGFVRYASLATMAVLLCLAIVATAEKLSEPTESSDRICRQLLSPDERRAVDLVPSGRGYALLAITCPVGSFDPSPRVMMNDLFFATHGRDYDIASDVEGTAKWLKKVEVDQLVYLDGDTSDVFGLRNWRDVQESLKPQSTELALWEKRELSYLIESLEKFRKLAQYCGSQRIPIRDPQGPLVIVDVRQCQGRGSAPELGPTNIK